MLDPNKPAHAPAILDRVPSNVVAEDAFAKERNPLTSRSTDGCASRSNGSVRHLCPDALGIDADSVPEVATPHKLTSSYGAAEPPVSDTLFWSNRGHVACRIHAPDPQSDRWQTEAWCPIPESANGRHGLVHQCPSCAPNGRSHRHVHRRVGSSPQPVRHPVSLTSDSARNEVARGGHHNHPRRDECRARVTY